jgi:hypothetical protein
MKSKNTITINKARSFHAVLLGLYPVLALYSLNITEISISSIRQALITSCLITLVIIGFFLLVFRSWERASVFASLSILMFFLYGHVFGLLSGVNEDLARHRYMIPLWLLIYAGCMIFLYKLQDVAKLTKTMNTVSLVLMAAVSVQILIFLAQSNLALRRHAETPQEQEEQPVLDSSDRDVYYILVDTFGRQDLMANDYRLDISSFTSELTVLGFYIPQCAQSNYDYTVPSLTSTLNMQYLDALDVAYDDGNEVFVPLLQHNLVRTRFENLGYSTVTFKSLYPALDIKDSTYYYDYFADETGMDSLASLNFQHLFLYTTALRPLLEYFESRADIQLSAFWASWIPVNTTLTSREYHQYQQNVFALDTLESMPDLPGKKFVYAHLYTAHQPFVFYPDGSFHPALPQTDLAYRDQVIFTTHRLLEIVKVILEKSEIPPIIIIQGDHSYSKLENRVKIMNAYYFPDDGGKHLYPTISPVNSFRVLFNTYYGAKYKLLEDVSFYGDDEKNLYTAPSTCMNGAMP